LCCCRNLCKGPVQERSYERAVPVSVIQRDERPRKEGQEIDYTNPTTNTKVTEFHAGDVANKLEFWKSITSDEYILEAVKGYKLEFESEPRVLFNNRIEQRFNKSDMKALSLEIEKLNSLGQQSY